MEKNKPYLFRIVAGDYLKERVKIPPEFVKNLFADMGDETTMSATIKGVAGQWSITVRSWKNNTYLEDGWEEVMKDNFLEDHQFLLFRYDGDMCFNLQIFDKNGCERIKAPVASEKEKTQQYVDIESDESERSSKGTNDRENSVYLPTQNPSFTVRMKDYHVKRVYVMRLPTDFCKKHFPLSGQKIVILRNSKGEGWEVTAVVNQGSYCLSKGWKDFAKANKIQLGKQYMFELLNMTEIMVKKA